MLRSSVVGLALLLNVGAIAAQISGSSWDGIVINKGDLVAWASESGDTFWPEVWAHRYLFDEITVAEDIQSLSMLPLPGVMSRRWMYEIRAELERD